MRRSFAARRKNVARRESRESANLNARRPLFFDCFPPFTHHQELQTGTLNVTVDIDKLVLLAVDNDDQDRLTSIRQPGTSDVHPSLASVHARSGNNPLQPSTMSIRACMLFEIGCRTATKVSQVGSS